MYVATSGSSIGLLTSFPVGNVEQYELRPLNFREFLYASNEQTLITTFENQINSPAAHNILFEKLTDYYFTGGMPEVMRTWYEMAGYSLLERVNTIQRSALSLKTYMNESLVTVSLLML